MATEIGALRVALEANTAQFERNIAAARKAVNDNARQMQQSVDRLRRSYERTQRAADTMRKAMLPLAAAVGAVSVAIGRAVSQADEIGKIADKVGVGVEALQELRFAAERTGVGSNTLDMALQRLTRRIGEAAQGKGELVATLRQYGIAVTDAQGRTRSTEDVLADIADTIQRTDSQAERLRIAFKAFDSEGAALVNTLREGSAGLDQMRARAQALGAVMDHTAVRAAERLNDRINELSASIGTRFNQALVLGTTSLLHFLGVLEAPEIDLAREIQATVEQIDRLNDAIAAGQPIRNGRGMVAIPVAQLEAERDRAMAVLEELRSEWEALFAAPDVPSVPSLEDLLGDLGGQQTPAETLLHQLEQATNSAALEVAVLSQGYDDARASLLRMAQAAGVTSTELADMDDVARRYVEMQRELATKLEENARLETAAANVRADIARAAQEALSPMQAYAQRLRLLNELLAEGRLTQGEFAKAIQLARQQLDEASEQANTNIDSMQRNVEVAADATTQLVDTAGRSFSRAFGVGRDEATSFRDVAIDALQEVQDFLFQMAVLNPLKNMLLPASQQLPTLANLFVGGAQLFAGSGGGAAAPLAAIQAPGATGIAGLAKGGVVQAGAQLERFARGGIVSAPTVFPMAKGIGLMGEAGPEAVLPLSRLANGDLGVAAQTYAILGDDDTGADDPSEGGNTFVFQVTTGVQPTVRAELINLMPRIAKVVEQAITDRRLRGKNRALR